MPPRNCQRTSGKSSVSLLMGRVTRCKRFSASSAFRCSRKSRYFFILTSLPAQGGTIGDRLHHLGVEPSACSLHGFYTRLGNLKLLAVPRPRRINNHTAHCPPLSYWIVHMPHDVHHLHVSARIHSTRHRKKNLLKIIRVHILVHHNHMLDILLHRVQRRR